MIHEEQYPHKIGQPTRQTKYIEESIPVPAINAPTFYSLSRIIESTGTQSTDNLPPEVLNEAVGRVHHYATWQTRINNGWKPVAPPDALTEQVRDLLRGIVASGDRAIRIQANAKYPELRRQLERYADYYKYVAFDLDEEGGYAFIETIFVSTYRYTDFHVSGFSDGWECSGFEKTDEVIRYIRQKKQAYGSTARRPQRELTEDDWARRVRTNPRNRKRCPPAIRSSALIAEAWRTGWIELIRRNPLQNDTLPAELQGDPFVIATQRSSLSALIQGRPDVWERCPPELQLDPEIEIARTAGWCNLVENDPNQWDKCPPELQQIPELLAARKSGWFLYSKNHLSYSKIPADLLSDAEMQERAGKLWQRQKDLSASEWLKCPEFVVATAPGIRNRIVAAITRALRHDPSFWLKLPPSWRQDPDLQHEATECWARSLDHHDTEPPEDIRERVKALLTS